MDTKVGAALTALKTLADMMGSAPMKANLKIIEAALADSARGVPLSALQAMTRHLDALATAEAGLRDHVQAMEGGVAPPSSKRTRGPNKSKAVAPHTFLAAATAYPCELCGKPYVDHAASHSPAVALRPPAKAAVAPPARP